MMIARVRAGFEWLLEAIVIALMIVLAAEVTIGVVFRTLGESLVWYDEVAAILLAWLTYYGAALAAMKRAHIGFSGVVDTLSPRWRLPAVALAEFCVFGFFILLAYIGWSVMDVLATDFLVSLPEISVKYTQSVIWIGAALFVIAEALMLPELIAQARRPGPMHHGPEVNP
jgi:TRAP-type C4-dicarboxylate transport system permease small subunit